VDERVIVSREPFNAETRLDLQQGPLTPPGRHYARSHFAQPDPPASVTVGGAVGDPHAFTIAELRALPSRSATVTLECAGNGRSFLRPPAPGEQWALGAVSTAEWTGVALRSLLEPRGLSPATVEILFRGADAGTPPGTGRRIAFERSLPLDRALADDVLVAYAMNGGPIPTEHGAPLRLVVPTWYGMASVKWLAEIVALEQPFRGFYQAERYVIGDRPLREMRPRAVIVAPLGEVAAARSTPIRGYAWSGHGPVARVEVSTDGGTTWRDARLGAAISPAAWREWTVEWMPDRGEHELIARAIDAAGEAQPLQARRDPLGYENNAAQPARIVAA
jgi:DMSO/TMAO reductase YedYZ molybdopterin-dependent catalytic subunit